MRTVAQILNSEFIKELSGNKLIFVVLQKRVNGAYYFNTYFETRREARLNVKAFKREWLKAKQKNDEFFSKHGVSINPEIELETAHIIIKKVKRKHYVARKYSSYELAMGYDN